MTTYAEILQKRKEDTMTNYDMDEIERQKDREKRSRGIVLQDTETHSVKTRELEINLPTKDCLKLALAAHDRDITLNQLIINVLTDSLKDLDYRFEHNNKPQFLAENIEEY